VNRIGAIAVIVVVIAAGLGGFFLWQANQPSAPANPSSVAAPAAATAEPSAVEPPTPEAAAAETATSVAAPAPILTPTLALTNDASLPAVLVTTATAPAGWEATTAPIYGYQVVNEYPHDPAAFTQGLVYTDGVLYEGTGLRGQSSLREVALPTGVVIQQHNLEPQYFGEGVAILDDRIYQLTWQEHTGFVYDQETFAPQSQFAYPTEGWGLTTDGQRLIMSDGSQTLYMLEPDTLQLTGRVEVRDGQQPVPRLNELEYVNGEVFANVWQTNHIARIDPNTGQVTGWIDLSGLLKPEEIRQRVDVLNGIAYDAEGDRLFVTGKLWPKLFEIELTGGE
jgi:glutamine cyclotransferase